MHALGNQGLPLNGLPRRHQANVDEGRVRVAMHYGRLDG